jgi:hypothetical protein
MVNCHNVNQIFSVHLRYAEGVTRECFSQFLPQVSIHFSANKFEHFLSTTKMCSLTDWPNSMSKPNLRLRVDRWQILKCSIINIIFNFPRNSTIDMKADVEISCPISVSKHQELEFVILKSSNLCKHNFKVCHQDHSTNTMPRDVSFSYTSRCEQYTRNISQQTAMRPGKEQCFCSVKIR